MISEKIDKDKILVSSSCSLLHVPFSLEYEEKMAPLIKSWLAYAVEKLDEIALVSKVFFKGVNSLDNKELELYDDNIRSNHDRKNSTLIHDEEVKKRVDGFKKLQRDGVYEERIKIQKKIPRV